MGAEVGAPPIVDPGAASGRAGTTPGLVRLLQSPLLHTLLRRILMGVLALLIVSALSFVLVSLIPGDAARQILGSSGTQEQYEELRIALGLDLPLYEQYGDWLGGALAGDFGTSLYGSDVAHELSSRLPVTLSLMLGALLVSVVVGVTLGVLSATRGGVLGRAVDALALAGFAFPSFWVAALLISFFAVQLRWFPATDYVPLDESPWEWFTHLVLPVTALSLHGIAMITKQTREAMLDTLASQHIRMAWASGLSPRSIVFRHALKNAGIRVVTILGVLAVSLLGGTVVVESIFALPGLGSLAVDATLRHDLPIIQAVVVYFTVMVVLINLVVDLTYSLLDPRVRAR